MRRILAAMLAVSLVSSGLTPVAANAAKMTKVKSMFAPATREFGPVRVHSSTGVTNPAAVLGGNPSRLSGADAQLVLDFGREVGGIVSLRFSAASGPDQRLGLAFSESSLYVGPRSDESNGAFADGDGAIFATVSGAGGYTMPAANLRGGFRYLTLFLDSTGWVDLTGVSLAFTPAPDMADPSAYPNSFSSSDELLNRIWHAGAYTVQMDTIKPTQGRFWPPVPAGWRNDGVIGVGTSIVSDGAKRDRNVWSGDLGISVPTAYVSTNDMVSTRNALTTLYNVQNKNTGELPYAGPPLNFPHSDTYHLWTLVATAMYYDYTGDRGWLDGVWPDYQKAVAYSIAKIGANGLMTVDQPADWARAFQGGQNIAANVLLFRVLVTGAQLATVKGETALSQQWTARANAVRDGANNNMWDPQRGLYRDNPTSGLYPQDGNSLAVWFGMANTADAPRISQGLTANWNAFGSTTPEKPGKIGTFPGSMEVLAHFTANNDQTGLDLVRREWGYMLNSPIGTASTIWEGFNADGTFDYGGNYMSLAHGWATGPTSALTNFVLGLAPTDPAGAYRFVPHPGDLANAEGRLTLPQGGALDGWWSHNAATHTFWQRVVAPAGTTGVVGIPTFGRAVVVTMDGTTVWNANTATAANVSTDGTYVYVAGVQPGDHTFTSQDAVLPALGGYATCAQEAQQCSFSGTQSVAYGANGHFVYGTFTGGTTCSNAVFGDPAFGVAKSCLVSASPPAFSPCVAEGGTCSYTGTRMVAYGAEGRFVYRRLAGPVRCDNSSFPDPIYGIPKACYLGGS